MIAFHIHRIINDDHHSKIYIFSFNDHPGLQRICILHGNDLVYKPYCCFHFKPTKDSKINLAQYCKTVTKLFLNVGAIRESKNKLINTPNYIVMRPYIITALYLLIYVNIQLPEFISTDFRRALSPVCF